MSFKSQLFGFMKRNYKLKIRNKFQTLSEIYNMSIILAILVMFSYLFKSKVLEPVNYDAIPINNSRTSVDVYITPNNQNTLKIGTMIKINYSNYLIKYFDNSNQMIEAYNNRSSTSFTNCFGIEFTNDSFPYQYKLYNNWDDSLFSNSKVNIFADSRECRKDLIVSSGNCAGNKIIFNGLALLQYNIDLAIKNVNIFMLLF
jgi:hypothetical protein